MSFLGGLHGETSKVKAEVEEDAEILFLPTEKKLRNSSKHIQNGWIIFSNYTINVLKNC